MSSIIGRISEKTLLREALNSRKSELIALYGRRRVGKTFLIREEYKGHIQFELTGLHNGNLSDQLDVFWKEISSRSKGNKSLEKPNSWFVAFTQLENYINSIKSKKKKVIFFDEFPWLATRRSKFLMSFENFWNTYASKRTDLVVVICGSAASFMVQKVIKSRGGLHNRITQKIRLLPFNLNETELFLKNEKISYTRYDILRLYMAIGGVPYYLEKIKKGESVPQALDRLCFEKDGILADEFNMVFHSLFNHPGRHTAIIKSLAGLQKGLTRNVLSKKSGLPTGGTFTQTLNELVESGFITQYSPFGKKNKGSLIRLTDEYCMFFLKFINTNRSTGAGTWNKLSNSRSYQSWSGFTFESVCLKHIEQIKAGLNISAIFSENSSWIDKGPDQGAQIDLLIDRADNVINLCEMKFSDSEFSITKRYAEELRNKKDCFKNVTKTRKNLYITLMTTHGVKENSCFHELVENELTMDCLFK